MSEARDKFVDSQGLPIHYLEWGEPAGEPLVLVHGYLDLAHSWKPFVASLQERLGKSAWIIAPDCRGHGDSGWIGAGGYYYFPDYVFDLSDAPLRMEKWITEVRERGRRHFRVYTSVEAGANQLRQTNPRLNDAWALELARAGMKQNDQGRWIWKFDPLHRTNAPQPFYTLQALEFFRRIECPVLIVDGKESRQTRRTDKQERYDAIRNHRRVTIDHAGHMVHHDNPAKLAEVIATFLKL